MIWMLITMDTNNNGVIEKDEYDIIFMDSDKDLQKISDTNRYLQLLGKQAASTGA